PQPSGFGDGLVRVVGKFGRDLDADKAVFALGAVVDRPEHIGGVADVFDRQRVEDLVGGVFLERHRAKLGIVVGGVGDGLFEDGRVGGQAGDVALVDHLLKVAVFEQDSADVVVPGRLA